MDLRTDQVEKQTALHVANVQLISEQETGGDTRVLFDLRWRNAWRNSRNHDAAWIFVKFIGQEGTVHLPIAASGHRTYSYEDAGEGAAKIDVATDQTGAFVYPSSTFRGDIDWRVSLRLATDLTARDLSAGHVEVFGVEMVHIPAGPFYVGDPDARAVRFGSYYRSGGDGRPAEFFHIDSEAAIPVGPDSGNLYYGEGTYHGDRMGPVPAALPKGFDAFYVMKYEPTQGQYAAFLNTLNASHATHRIHLDAEGYREKRGTIRQIDDRYIADRPDRPLNFIHWDDGLAFADWSGLRPMTEFEFAKAARGPERPAPNTFPWGTDSRETLARIVGANDDLIMTTGWDEAMLGDETRAEFGASYYWVMDLAGSVWERVVTPSRSDGRMFTGTHGDGMLADSARADNADWPHGYLGREGHGYRGGGFYDQGRVVHEFNPWSPVAYRRFGGWSGYDVHRAYGFRAARTAEPR